MDLLTAKPLIGMVHLPALPGSPNSSLSLDAIEARAVGEARLLEYYGFDGVVVENYGDVPFYPDHVPLHTVAAMTRVAQRIREAVRIPLGVNVLRNDSIAALSIAAAVGAEFTRVNVHVGAMLTDQGILQGRAYETLRLRDTLGCDVRILADVCVKHAVPLAETSLVALAEDTFHRGLADALIVTGQATGSRTDQADLVALKAALPTAPILVGSGVSEDNLAEVLTHADGAIVGTSLKYKGITTEPMEPSRINRLVAQRRRLMESSVRSGQQQ